MPDIRYEDEQILVVWKPAGQESQTGRTFSLDLESELRNELARRHPGTRPYLGVVHRLDRPVCGWMVYAKTKKAAAGLSAQFASGLPHKRYEAVVAGRPVPEAGVLEDLLCYDGKNHSRVAGPGETDGKRSRLSYRVIRPEEARVFHLEDNGGTVAVCQGSDRIGIYPGKEKDCIAFLSVLLYTGRHHQIRVQLSSRGYPVLGDTEYGGGSREPGRPARIALGAAGLSFRHPASGKQMCFEA